MISKNRIKYLRSLKQKKYRQKYNKFVCEGVKIIKEVLSLYPDRIDSLYLTEPGLEKLAIPVESYEILSPQELKQISTLDTNNDGLGVIDCPIPLNVEDITLNRVQFYLDGIRDPGNMGTIIRICDWFGIKNLFLSADCVDIFNTKCVQASMGSIFRVNVLHVDLQSLHDQFPEMKIYKTSMSDLPYQKAVLETNNLIVMGSESHGISQETDVLIKDSLTIPGNSDLIDSLNVAIATGVLAAHFSQ